MSKNATAIMVALFPESSAKFVAIGGEEDGFQAIDNLMCFAPEFDLYFKRFYDEYDTAKTIYILGPDDYVEPFVQKMESIVKDNVDFIKEKLNG